MSYDLDFDRYHLTHEEICSQGIGAGGATAWLFTVPHDWMVWVQQIRLVLPAGNTLDTVWLQSYSQRQVAGVGYELKQDNVAGAGTFYLTGSLHAAMWSVANLDTYAFVSPWLSSRRS